MVEKFLKAKHWQLFLLTIGIPMTFQIVIIEIGKNHNPSFIINYMKFSPMMIIIMGVLFGWFWSIAIGLQNKVPKNVKMKVQKFKIFFFVPIGYILFDSIYMGGVMSGMMESGSEPSGGLIDRLVAIIVALCFLHSMYFVSKTFKTVELQRELKFGDFAREFFMIWLYPIGIWIVQPKINKMFEE